MTTTEPTVCDLETRRQAVRDAWDRLDEAIARDRAREQALKSEREKDEEGGMSKHYTTDDSRSAAAELDTAREAAMVLLNGAARRMSFTLEDY